jgi:transcriptional regulator with XRE-family HTH domain
VPDDWTAVAEQVRARREFLRLTQEQAAAATEKDVSTANWSVIERGGRTSYRNATLKGVCRVLDWTPDSIDRILRGEEPVVMPPRQATLEELRAAGFTAYERPAAPSVALEQLGQVGDLGRRVSSLEKQMSEVLALVRRLPDTDPDGGGDGQ